jgi:RNA polymerase sigma-70 factor (ECF subfamily)
MAVASEEAVNSGVDLAELVRSHQADVWRYLRFLGAGAEEATDLTQEVFLAVVRKPFQIRSPAETAAYLRSVARRQLLMLRRRQRREITTTALDAAETVWAAAIGTAGSFDTYLDALARCLETLDGRARQAIDLHYRDNASRTDIAAKLDMKPEGVKTLLRRTRHVLRECIERQALSKPIRS